MTALQLACLAIVLTWGLDTWRERADRVALARRYLLVVVAAWLAEDSCIRLYGFYAYDPRWWAFVDRVPLLVVLIWPVVILTAEQVVRRLTARQVALATGLVVLTDAALIEPVSVRAGLWSWTEPGLFGVPPVGVLGWAFFAALATAVRGPLVLVLAPAGTHLLLLAAWWGALRWCNHAIPAPGAVALALTLSLAGAAACWRQGLAGRVPPRQLLTRMAAAAFFGVLLLLYGRDDAWLLLWAAAAALPWLVLTLGRARPPS